MLTCRRLVATLRPHVNHLQTEQQVPRADLCSAGLADVQLSLLCERSRSAGCKHRVPATALLAQRWQACGWTTQTTWQ